MAVARLYDIMMRGGVKMRGLYRIEMEAKQYIDNIDKVGSNVPDGSYNAFIVNAYVAPSSKGLGDNLIVDFSLHAPNSPYNKWIIRRYMNLASPGRQLQELFSSGKVSSPTDLIGRLFKIQVKREVFGTKIQSGISSLAPVNWSIPSQYAEILDIYEKMIDTKFNPDDDENKRRKRVVHRKELSVNRFRKAIGRFFVDPEDGDVKENYPHYPSRGWMLTHIIGHNQIKMPFNKMRSVAVSYTGDWNYEVFPDVILYQTAYEQVGLVTGLARNEVSKRCHNLGIREPLGENYPLLLPWHSYNTNLAKFVGDGVEDNIESQLTYLRKVLS
ncbi:hypothetical protein D3C78_17580 [compost metagenome]